MRIKLKCKLGLHKMVHDPLRLEMYCLYCSKIKKYKNDNRI